MNPEIALSLQQLSEFFDLDRISLFEFSAETARLHLLCAFTAPGLERPPDVLDLSQEPLAASQILRETAIFATNLDQLPDESGALKEVLHRRGVRSIAIFPLKHGDDTFAALAFSTVRNEREWNQDLVQALRTIADIFASALERRRTEKELAESRNRLTGIVESATDAIIAVNMHQRIVVFNDAAEKMFRCPAERALGQSVEQFIPNRFRSQHARYISEFGEAGVTNRSMGGALSALTALRAGGEEFPIEASISQVQMDGGKLFTVIIRDITERQRAEQLLRESHQLNASILESQRNHVAGLDSKGMIIAATKREPGFAGVAGIDLLDLRVGGNYFDMGKAAAEAGDSDVAAALSGVQSIYTKIHIRQGNGAKDRDVPLSPKLLEELRSWWRWKKPQGYLFPSTEGQRGTGQPISDKTVWHACHSAATRSGLKKKIHPHTLRHSYGRTCSRPAPTCARFANVLSARLGRLCQAALRRTGTCAALSGSLYASRRYLQPSPAVSLQLPRFASAGRTMPITAGSAP